MRRAESTPLSALQNFRDRPIRQKITAIVIVIAGAVLLPAFFALFGFQVYTLKQASLHELVVMGEMTAHNCTTAVMFKDADVSAQILGGLKAMPQIVSGQLELEDHQRLASFGTYQDQAEIKASRLTSGFQFNGDRILLAQPVMVAGKREGTLYLLADLHAMTAQLLTLYSAIFALILAVSLLAAFILSRKFLHFLTDPILRLAGAARTVAEHNDYSVRAVKSYDDEVGVLTDAFNQMLAQIQTQDSALRESEEKLAQSQRIAHLGHWERDLISQRIHWSDETYRIFGLQPGQTGIDGDHFQDLIHADDRDKVTNAIARAAAGEVRYDMEYRVVRPDGEIRFVHSQGDLVKDESGQPRHLFGTVQDITEQKQSEEALRKAEQKYREIFENSIEGIFQTTPEGRYLSVNPTLARMYGYDSAEELISSVTDIGRTVYVDPGMRREFEQLVEKHGFVKLFEYEVYRRDGTKMWICENARAVRGDNGEISYYEGTIEDITHRKRVEEIERVNKAKNEFLSRVSHELRTPLNAILGFSQLLERQNPSESQKIRIRYIIDAGKHLLQLINEVLDISRIESGRLELSLEPVGIVNALTEALDLMRPLAVARSIHLPTAAGFDRTLFVKADQQRFKQVLLNLLTNAVKYTPVAGNVTISCLTDMQGRVRIFVTDTGAGIPQEKLDRLFMPFERLGAEQSNVEGTGLGLALSQRLMQAMGGSIGVKSKVGEGSTFWLELPRAELPAPEISPTRKTEPESKERGLTPHRRVLYIEDNLSNVSLVEQLLEERPGIELLQAHQAEAGLTLAQQHLPDLILLDIHLPDLDGCAVLTRLKASKSTRDIPVVVVSADATSRQVNRLMTAGATSYLTKPLDVGEFFRVLDKTTAVSDRKNRREPAFPASNPAEVPNPA
ncbi:MAG TPA: PAS domain S-box protein [Chthoniobacterales bacterium]|nr:PAS domain S-box protein [Chthoniobacterales bacterium]